MTDRKDDGLFELLQEAQQLLAQFARYPDYHLYVASDKAHGHVTINTDTATIKAWPACAMLFKVIRGKQTPVVLAEENVDQATQPRHWALPILFGAVIGTLVTLTSVGAGAIGVTVLMILYPQLPLSRIVAADIAYAVPLTLTAGLGHASLGSVDWPLLGLLLAGSLPGIWVGSRLMHKTPERVIRSILSVLLAWAGSKLVFA